ncbi:MAG: heavy-metal-associated domain-containing protein [Clostridia bacterium]|nr:heavy-metal-associated domain-containing protein [Clostridia bacterium]
MTKSYNIEVDCANCAAKMQDAAGKVTGVISVNVSFMALKMTVEFEDGADTQKVMKDILRVCRRIEPDCEIFF